MRGGSLWMGLSGSQLVTPCSKRSLARKRARQLRMACWKDCCLVLHQGQAGSGAWCNQEGWAPR